jgi:hypothetical protein
MQVLPVYLYQNNLVVTLDLDPTVRGDNRIMYQRDLKIQKGLKNKIRVQFKNSDQKSVPVNDSRFVFSMYDNNSQQLVLERDLEILDQGTTSTRGLSQLTITESDTIDLPKSSYTFSIKQVDSDGTYLPTYSNSYYGVSGTLHLLNDINPVLKPSKVIDNFLYSYNDTTQLYEFKSRAIPANPEFNSNSALHTVAVYMTNFRGQVIIKATLNNNPDDLAYYATVDTLYYDGFDGVDYANFNGIYSYIQIVYIPDQGPGDLDNLNNTEYRGILDKILYRS